MAPKLALLIAVSAAFGAFAQSPTPFSINDSPLPAPTGFVNDYAGVIDAPTKQQLESKLKNFRDTTNPSVEIAVAVVKTTGDRDIFDYSLAVARGWKIGSKADDNPGALLLVAIDDRKYFTQVSKDLEGDLPDGAVGSLQRQYLVPEFKKGNYSKGISDTIDAYISTIRNKGNAPVAPNRNTNRPRQPTSVGAGITSSIGSIICCGIVILVILIIIFSRRGRGGGIGGGGSGLAGNIASGVIGGLIGSALSGGGSSDSGSSWGGSSDSGGGFGGFGGGGDFGGGGAGGDW